MRYISKLWILIFVIIVIWCYYIFIYPKIFDTNIIIPDVVGLKEEVLIEKLDEENIKYKITYLKSDSDLVLKTFPYAGMKIKKDFIIDVFIGKIIPKSYCGYLGLLYTDVKEEIEILCNDFNLNLIINYKEDNFQIAGVIIDESIVVGEEVKYGDTLILTVSMNNLYFKMPNLVGLNIYDALKIIDDYNLKVNVEYYSSFFDYDTVLFQSINKDTIIKKGNQYEITLYVSKGVL